MDDLGDLGSSSSAATAGGGTNNGGGVSCSQQLPTLVEETEMEKQRAGEQARKKLAPTASISDDDAVADEMESGEDEQPAVLVRGLLYKWTNYLHGWQPRYFVLKEGSLSYYKSEYDASFACRGSAAVTKARVELNENDDCRFDVAVNDAVWYLRAETPVERQQWTEGLEHYKTDSGFGSQSDLRRHGSLMSIASAKSLQSTSSFKKTQCLRERLAELETYHDIVSRQVDSLQSYFDASCALNANAASANTRRHDDRQGGDGSTWSSGADPLSLDLKGEALTFKATTAAILTTVENCVDVVQQREDVWRRRLEREVERRRRAEELCKQRGDELRRITDGGGAKPGTSAAPAAAGPDFVEGPHSTMNEEQWFDAVDAALEREDLENERIERILTCRGTTWDNGIKPYAGLTLPKHNTLFPEIDRLTLEQLRYAKAGVAEGVWELFAEDGEMRMYKRDEELNGMICDPLKATHTVKGVTAFEYMHCFFESGYKLDWDTTLETMRVVEKLSDDTMILHQIHKRVWPANQRDSLFWSHFRKTDSLRDSDAHDCFIVCNKDTDRNDVTPPKGSLRLGLTIAMVCQTVVTGGGGKRRANTTRDDISCRIIYVAQVNPGGWAPSPILRMVYKKEYPKFLKRFTHFVLQKADNKPIMWG